MLLTSTVSMKCPPPKVYSPRSVGLSLAFSSRSQIGWVKSPVPTMVMPLTLHHRAILSTSLSRLREEPTMSTITKRQGAGETPQPEDWLRLVRMIHGYRVTQMLAVAAKLGIADFQLGDALRPRRPAIRGAEAPRR